ncbi:MAG: hypothetical protein R2909_22805 [Gemmatimonadales bacterium]
MTGTASTIRYDHPVRLSALARRLTQPNPGPFTGPGTNTFLVGARSLVILEPGEARDDDHLERIVAAVAGSRVLAVIPSHGHEDHWTLAPALAGRLGAPIWYHGAHPSLQVDLRFLEDGDEIALDGARLDVPHTPGLPRALELRAPRQGRALPGRPRDGGGPPSIIAPPEGIPAQYLRSLGGWRRIPGLEVAHPAHGEAFRIHAVGSGSSDPSGGTHGAAPQCFEGHSARWPALVGRVYTDVDPSLHPAAALSLRAHLIALESEGRVTARAGGDAADWESTIWALTGG